MPKNKLYRFQYDHMSCSTVLWLLQIAKETGVLVENICWYNKRDPRITLKNVMIKDPDEYYACQITLASESKKKLNFINYLFYARKHDILKLIHCYNKEHKDD